jgi:hypothetical protein
MGKLTVTFSFIHCPDGHQEQPFGRGFDVAAEQAEDFQHSIIHHILSTTSNAWKTIPYIMF